MWLIYLTTKDDFEVDDLNGDESDIFICQLGILGTETACSFDLDLYFDGSESDFDGERINGLSR